MIGRFRVGPADLLGRGGESEVYALDESRVLRVCWPGASSDYVDRRRELYAWLDQQGAPFELPLVLERGTVEDRIYTVERRLSGRVFSSVLPGLTGVDRERALASYLSTAARISSIEPPSDSFGELLVPGEPLRRDSWPRFLWDRLQQTYRVSRADLERDVPGIDAVLEHVAGELRALEGFAERRLVHGDYFPGNVYIGDDLEIRGVGDFGYTTVVGDPRMDLAGAVAFLEVVDGYDPADTALITQLARDLNGADIVRWLDLYRLYYSFYFSTCKVDDPPTYAWCIHNLRSIVRR